MSGSALDVIAAEADAAAAPEPQPGAAGAGPGPQTITQSPNVAAVGFILTAFRTVAGMLLKVESLDRTLNDANVQQCAEAIAPVADKYGLDLQQFLGGSVEAAAVMVAGPILWTAASELQNELKARRAKPVKPDEGEAQPGASDGG